MNEHHRTIPNEPSAPAGDRPRLHPRYVRWYPDSGWEIDAPAHVEDEYLAAVAEYDAELESLAAMADDR